MFKSFSKWENWNFKPYRKHIKSQNNQKYTKFINETSAKNV